MLFTDAPGLPLEDERNATNPHYPSDANMPKSLSKIEAEYNDEKLIHPLARRLLIFAPNNCYPWFVIGNRWDVAWPTNVIPGDGLSEFPIDMLIAALPNPF